MKFYQALPLLAGLANAAPAETRQGSTETALKSPSIFSRDAPLWALLPRSAQQSDLPASSNNVEGFDPALIGKAVLEIISDDAASVERRGKPDGKREAISAADAADKKMDGSGKKGVFFRGDSRPPEQIFAEGFQPRGSDMDLGRHLSFAGGSGYVSVSRSQDAAYRYAFGRTGAKLETGYIYMITPSNLPEGYWLPDIYSKDPAVRGNQEFAAAGSIPVSNIAGAFEVNSKNPDAKGRWIENKRFAFKKLSCSVQKRAVCVPSTEDDERPKKLPQDGEEQKKKKPGHDGEEPKKKLPQEEEPAKTGKGNGDKPKGKSTPVFAKIAESKFLRWVADTSPEAFKPLAEAISSGEITVADCQLAFKRAVSATLENRWTDFGSWEAAGESLKNILLDIFQTARTKVPVGFWEDVLRNLPKAAKEVAKGKTPEEKLKLANESIHPAMKVWSYTPVGIVNENLMKESAAKTPPVQAAAVSIHTLWSYTPLGWLVNKVYPIEPLLRKVNVRSVDE